MCDFGTGNNNKMNWVLEDKQELIDIVRPGISQRQRWRTLLTACVSRLKLSTKVLGRGEV